jgi:hypothetical protein
MYTGGGDAIISQNEKLSLHTLKRNKSPQITPADIQTENTTTPTPTTTTTTRDATERERERGKNREDLGKCAPTRKGALAKGERRSYDRALCLFPFMGKKKSPTPLQVHPKKEIPEVLGDGISWKRRFYLFFLIFLCEFFQHNILSFMLKPKKIPQKNLFNIENFRFFYYYFILKQKFKFFFIILW